MCQVIWGKPLLFSASMWINTLLILEWLYRLWHVHAGFKQHKGLFTHSGHRSHPWEVCKNSSLSPNCVTCVRVFAAEGKIAEREREQYLWHNTHPPLPPPAPTHTYKQHAHTAVVAARWPNSSVHMDKKHTQTSGGLDAAEFLSVWAMPRRAPLWCADWNSRALQSVWNRPSVHETVMDTTAIKTKTAATKGQTDNKPFQIFRLFESPCACEAVVPTAVARRPSIFIATLHQRGYSWSCDWDNVAPDVALLINLIKPSNSFPTGSCAIQTCTNVPVKAQGMTTRTWQKKLTSM